MRRGECLTRTVIVPLVVKKPKATRVLPGQPIPDKAGTMTRHYRIEIPDKDYERLKENAKKEHKKVEQIIRSTYKYPKNGKQHAFKIKLEV